MTTYSVDGLTGLSLPVHDGTYVCAEREEGGTYSVTWATSLTPTVLHLETQRILGLQPSRYEITNRGELEDTWSYQVPILADCTEVVYAKDETQDISVFWQRELDKNKTGFEAGVAAINDIAPSKWHELWRQTGSRALEGQVHAIGIEVLNFLSAHR